MSTVLFILLLPEDMCWDSSQAGQEMKKPKKLTEEGRLEAEIFDKVMGISRQILKSEATKPAETGGAKILEKMKS